MIVKFELNGHECEADVRSVGTPDECTDWRAPDESYEIRWIQDSGAPQRDLDNAAVEAYLAAIKSVEAAKGDRAESLLQDSLMRSDLAAMQVRHPSLSRARCIGMLESSYLARRRLLDVLFNEEFGTNIFPNA